MLVVAVDAPDLLDQVRLPAHVVVAMDGDLRDDVIPVATCLESEPLEVGDAVVRLDAHPQEGLGPPRAEPRTARRR